MALEAEGGGPPPPTGCTPTRWLEARRSCGCARVERQVGMTRKWPDGGVGQRPATNTTRGASRPACAPPAPGSGAPEVPRARRMPVPDTFQNRKGTRCLGTNGSGSHLSRYSGGNGLKEKGALPPPLPGERERRASQLTHHFCHFKTSKDLKSVISFQKRHFKNE